MNYQPKTSRELLTDLGVGRFNATMLVETMMMAPAVTEASSAPVMMLVQHLQIALRSMGAPVASSGVVDLATDQAIAQIVGSNWLYRTWFDVTRMVVEAKRAGRRLTAPAPAPSSSASMGLLDLPDVPGGAVTYGVGAYLLYRLFRKGR